VLLHSTKITKVRELLYLGKVRMNPVLRFAYHCSTLSRSWTLSTHAGTALIADNYFKQIPYCIQGTDYIHTSRRMFCLWFVVKETITHHVTYWRHMR